MVVTGQRIVAVCEDNTVNVYDAVTGVLRWSLIAPRQVTKVQGSPDGSIIFCAHQRFRKITTWDTQTGGLIHTFTTNFEIKDIAVSSKGKYLASCSSDGIFRFWEMESRSGGSRFWDQPVLTICWLEPEDQVALVVGEFVVILEMSTGRTLHTIRTRGGVREITFSAGQHLVAVLSTFETRGIIEIVDINTELTLISSAALENVSCFTFSGNGDRLFCATKAGDLQSLHISEPSPNWHDHRSHPATMHSMTLLPSGHLVVNSGGSIQLLKSEYSQPFTASPDPEIAHIYQLDNDKAICVSSRDHRDASLLDLETMKTLANHRDELDKLDEQSAPRFLCTSIKKDTAILCHKGVDGFALKRYKIGHTSPIWEQSSPRPAILGTLSPSGRILVTVHSGGDPSERLDWSLCFWMAAGRGRKLHNSTVAFQGTRPPSRIAFTSETQFYIEEREVFSSPTITSKHASLHPQESDVIPKTTTSKQPDRHTSPRVQKPVIQRLNHTPFSTTNSEGQSRTGIHHEEYYIRENFSLRTFKDYIEMEEVSEEEILVIQPYALDESLEWVVDAESRRVCWLPPGYVTRNENGYCFFGSSIVMAGQDGIVRTLTFTEPTSDL